jgi:hypothetical protein
LANHDFDTPPPGAPLGQLERALIDEYVVQRGYDPVKLHDVPEPERKALLKQASLYASARLSEVESRSQYVHDLHTGGPHSSKSGLE